MNTSRRPTPGTMALACFFAFGTTMCALTLLALAFPDGALRAAWRIKPEAQGEFLAMGRGAFALMGLVGAACALAAIGLLRSARWGWRLALGVLSVNLIGDATHAVLRSDPRTLIGLPIGACIIAWLLRADVRARFRRGERQPPILPSHP